MARSPYTINSYSGDAPTALLMSGITNSGTVVIISGTTSGWGPLGTTGGFNLALDYGSSAEEKIYAPSGSYSWSSGVVTISGVSRGADGTNAIAHNSNTVVAFVSTATDFQEANYLVNQVLSKNVIPNNITVSGFVTIPQASSVDNIPTNNGVSFSNNSYMYNDGNLHITSSGGSIWINANDGSNVKINAQSPATGGLDVGGKLTASNISDTGWVSVSSFSNGFSAVSSDAVAYRVLNGVVYLRGAVQGGTAGTTAFTLPNTYSISTPTMVYATQQYGSSGDSYVTVVSGSSIAIQPQQTSAWLPGVTFPLG